MRNGLIWFCSFVLVLLAVAAPARTQEDKSKRPSPPAQAKFAFPDGKTITIDYSSPRMRGRKIFGGLVPYGKVWRLGANDATTFVTTSDLNVGGTAVPAGSYTLFAIPETGKWTLIISKTTGEWGTNYSGPGNDLARIKIDSSALSSPVQDFLIAFDKSGDACVLRFDWETTRASVDISERK
ncbi:MAG TPA: DUF2911 domain-containing protein [Verrucomicrobiae bacterium]|nr:DUF2911 domain-containing protein [Verrucomicrobiae bacterium]